jgi:hypothetical protein
LLAQGGPLITNTPAARWERIIEAANGEFPPELARYLLTLAIPDQDQERMDLLLAKARTGTLTEAENQEADNYLHVSHVLGFLQSKARLALKKTPAHS